MCILACIHINVSFLVLLLVGSSVITAIPRYMYPSVTSELYNITVVCIIHPDSTADQCEVMAVADDGRVTITGEMHNSTTLKLLCVCYIYIYIHSY